MSWLARVMGRSPPKQQPAEPAPIDPHVNAACSFCGKSRQEVHKLVVGQTVYICDECVGLTVQIIDEEMRAEQQRSYHVDLILGGVAHGGVRLPHAIATPMLRAVIELAAGDPLVLRRVVASASNVSDLATAHAALAAIPVDERTITDRINIACLLADLGRASDAVAAMDAIDAAAVPDEDTAWFRLTRAYTDLERGAVPRPRAAVHRSTAVELAPVVTALPAGGFEDSLRLNRLAVLALADLALGELADAEQAARARVELSPNNPACYEILARVLAAKADHAGAEAARTQGRELAHPDGPLARRLRDGSPYRA